MRVCVWPLGLTGSAGIVIPLPRFAVGICSIRKGCSFLGEESRQKRILTTEQSQRQ